jgi:hypothetical protein
VSFTLIAIGLLAGISPPARAQTRGFDIRIGEKELALADPNDLDLQASLEYDNGFTRMWHRNMPAIQLENTSDPTLPNAQINQFVLQLQDDEFTFSKEQFGVAASLGSTTPGFILDSEVLELADGSRLVVDISKQDGTGGLAPGEVVRFHIQLGVQPQFADDIFPYPDFRTVLFDINADPTSQLPVDIYDGDANGDNALAIVQFADGTAIPPQEFEDRTLTDDTQLYFNGTFPRHSTHQNLGDFGTEGMIIPEPGSALLAVFALVNGWVLTARRWRTM